MLLLPITNFVRNANYVLISMRGWNQQPTAVRPLHVSTPISYVQGIAVAEGTENAKFTEFILKDWLTERMRQEIRK